MGKEKATPYNDLEFRYLDYKKAYGINELTEASIDKFRKKIQDDEKLREQYMIEKIGYDPANSDERKRAMDIYVDKGLAVEVAPG